CFTRKGPEFESTRIIFASEQQQHLVVQPHRGNSRLKTLKVVIGSGRSPNLCTKKKKTFRIIFYGNRVTIFTVDLEVKLRIPRRTLKMPPRVPASIDPVLVFYVHVSVEVLEGYWSPDGASPVMLPLELFFHIVEFEQERVSWFEILVINAVVSAQPILQCKGSYQLLVVCTCLLVHLRAMTAKYLKGLEHDLRPQCLHVTVAEHVVGVEVLFRPGTIVVFLSGDSLQETPSRQACGSSSGRCGAFSGTRSTTAISFIIFCVSGLPISFQNWSSPEASVSCLEDSPKLDMVSIGSSFLFSFLEDFELELFLDFSCTFSLEEMEEYVFLTGTFIFNSCKGSFNRVETEESLNVADSRVRTYPTEDLSTRFSLQLDLYSGLTHYHLRSPFPQSGAKAEVRCADPSMPSGSTLRGAGPLARAIRSNVLKSFFLVFSPSSCRYAWYPTSAPLSHSSLLLDVTLETDAVVLEVCGRFRSSALLAVAVELFCETAELSFVDWPTNGGLTHLFLSRGAASTAILLELCVRCDVSCPIMFLDCSPGGPRNSSFLNPPIFSWLGMQCTCHAGSAKIRYPNQHPSSAESSDAPPAPGELVIQTLDCGSEMCLVEPSSKDQESASGNEQLACRVWWKSKPPLGFSRNTPTVPARRVQVTRAQLLGQLSGSPISSAPSPPVLRSHLRKKVLKAPETDVIFEASTRQKKMTTSRSEFS
ncbi:hypothetical protein C0J52_18055, partial [Blattella germanica]